MTARTTYIVGLTGGVGSGKSTAAQLFAELGAYVVDVDDISHALTAKGGSAIAAIAAAFPDAVSEATLDRARLREQVFADAQSRRRLEAILHPLIRESTQRALTSDAAHAAPYVLLVVPLLFEANAYAALVECAIVVDAPVATQIERVVTTRGLSNEVAKGIVAAQMSREDRLRRAQFVIDNSSDHKALQAQVQRLHSVLAGNATAAQANEFDQEAVV
jgi:dephospho-CoA kinase